MATKNTSTTKSTANRKPSTTASAAQKKSATTRNTSPKAPPKKKPSETAKQRAAAQAQRLAHHRNQVGGVVLFGVSLLLLALLFIKGQNIWLVLHNILFGIFGIGAYLLPILFVFIAVKATSSERAGYLNGKILQTLLIVCVFCGIVQVSFIGNFASGTFLEIIQSQYMQGASKIGGGVLSLVFGWPLYMAFGRVAASIVFFIVLIVLILLVTGTTITDAFSYFAAPVRKMGDQCVRIREERAEAREKRFNIDVDLGPNGRDADGMPLHPVASSKTAFRASNTKEDALTPELTRKLEEKEATEKREFLLNQQTPAESFLSAVKESEEHSIKVAEKTKKEKENQLEELVKRAVPKATESLSVPVTEVSPPIEQPSVETSLPIEEEKLSKKEERKIVAEKAAEFSSELNQNQEVKQLQIYKYPPISLLKAPVNRRNNDLTEELKMNAELLVNTLKSFGVQTRVIDISRGPTVTRYELQPSAGVKISKITGLADDIALNLAAAGVRIEAPIPNKAAVGIEVPNKQTEMVSIREIVESKTFKDAKSKLAVALGRDISGNEVVFDIGKMPHMLIAGATGSGKSVCINTLIVSLLYKSTPDDVRLLMIDPKVVELGIYNGIPHLLVPVVTDPRKAAGALGWAVTEMLNRYKLFADNQVRDLAGYNELAQTNEELNPLPQIVIIIDELADLMMAAPNEVEDAICRLAQMARAAGMHLVIATQRPSVDVITGVIKANIPSRIAFAVSSQVDSRTIIDSGGAEKLLGRGDMLFAPVGSPKPTRLQCCYVSDKEVEAVVDFVKNSGDSEYDNKIMDEIEKQAVPEKGKEKSNHDGGGFSDDDELLPQAIECVLEAGQASTSYLQRKLKVGYARAARLIDDMEEKRIIGPFEGSKPRSVLLTRNQWIEMKMTQATAAETTEQET